MYVREDFDQRQFFGEMGSWVSSALKKIGLAKKKEPKKTAAPATTAVAPTTPRMPAQQVTAGFDFQKYQKYILPAALVVGGLIVLKLVLKKKPAIQKGDLL